jgi:FMN phosphatase YigB (HAD superfamily)|tara:strand:- start:953 stop:1522 length:570 start_codon:yes stop_codon:yes gene_type:complete
MKKIITDCDGVLLDWCFAFDIWMKEQGYVRFPETDHYFEQTKRYGIPEDEALEQVHKFNETGVLGFVPAYKDSVEFITKFAREGWRFEVITMIGKDKYAHQLRKANLKHLFGDVFDYIYCAGDFRKPKKEILEERYKGKDYIWVEDRVDYAIQGKEVGLNTFMMDHPYNRDGWDGKRVKNWSELYDAAH